MPKSVHKNLPQHLDGNYQHYTGTIYMHILHITP